MSYLHYSGLACIVCCLVALIISAIKINVTGFSGFNDPDIMDSRLFYDFRKIYRKIFRSKKVSVDLKETNDKVDEKIVSVPEVIKFIKN